MILLKKYNSRLVAVIISAAMISSLISCEPENESVRLEEDVTIIPYPAKVLKRSGYVTLESNFWVVVDFGDTTMAHLGQYLVDEIDRIPGALASIADIYSTRKLDQAITLEKVNDTAMHKQGYELSITSRNIAIRGRSEQGIFYGVQSVLSLIENQWKTNLRKASVRKMVITDYPKSNFRFADLRDLKDSVQIESLLKALTRSKINYLIIDHKQIDSGCRTKLNNNYIAPVIRENFTMSITVIPADDIVNINSLSTNSLLYKSDTLIVSLQPKTIGKLTKDLLRTGQLGWSGAGKKDNEWLIEQVQ